MKELTIEQKAQRYDEAVINGSRLWESDIITRASYEYMFPEIKENESEDEKIRKFLIKQANSVLDSITDDDEEVPAWKSALAWLEKRGEQKSLSEEDENIIEWLIGYLEYQIMNATITEEKDNCLDAISMLKSIKYRVQPKPAWSEEDKMQLDAAIHLVSSTGHIETTKWLISLKDKVVLQQKQDWSEEDERIRIETIELLETANHPNKMRSNGKPLDFTENINWLKSLRPQSTWMPTPEQVDALQIAIENAEHEKEYSNQNALVSLMEDLKKL